MDPGSLRARVILQSPPTALDSQGQPIGDWVTVATVRANIRHHGGLEAIKASGDTSVVKASIRIRYRAAVAATWRVVHGSKTYGVAAVLPDGRKQWTDLVCELVQ